MRAPEPEEAEAARIVTSANLCRVLALLFFAAALGWWIYSPWLDCEPGPFGACGALGGEEVGLILNFAIVAALIFVGASLWTQAPDR